MEASGLIFSIVGLGAMLIPVVLIGVLIFMLVRKNSGEANGNKSEPITQVLSFKNLFRLYLYVIVSISAFVLLIGVSTLGKVVLGLVDQNMSYGYEMAGEDYSKPVIPDSLTASEFVCYDTNMEMTTINGKKYCFNNNEMKMDLINGAVISISMMVIFVLHLVLLVNQEHNSPTHNIKKIFVFGNLIIYSVLSLVVLPVSLYQLFSYLIILEKPVYSYQTPGGLLSFAIVLLFGWIGWLTAMVKIRDSKQAKVV